VSPSIWPRSSRRGPPALPAYKLNFRLDDPAFNTRMASVIAIAPGSRARGWPAVLRALAAAPTQLADRRELSQRACELAFSARDVFLRCLVLQRLFGGLLG